MSGQTVTNAEITAYKSKIEVTYTNVRELSKNSENSSNNLAKDIMDKYTTFLKNLSNSAVCRLTSRNRLKQNDWNSIEGTLYDDIKKLQDETKILIDLFCSAKTELLKLFVEEGKVEYPTLEAIPKSDVPNSSGSTGKANTGGSTISNTPSGGNTYNITGGTTGPSYTYEDIMRAIEEWMKEHGYDGNTGAMQCNCSCSEEFLALLKQLVDLLKEVISNPNRVTDGGETVGETTPAGTDAPVVENGSGTGAGEGTTTPADNSENELPTGPNIKEEDPTMTPDETPDDETPGEVPPDDVTPSEDEDVDSFIPSFNSPSGLPTLVPSEDITPDDITPDDITPDETPDDPDVGYTLSFVNPFDSTPDNPDDPNNPYDPNDPDNDNKEPSGGTVNETPTPPPSRNPGGTGDGGSTLPPSKGPGTDDPGEPSTKPDPDPKPGVTGDEPNPTPVPSTNPDPEPGVTGDEPSPTPIPSTKPDNPSQPPSGGTTDWGGDGSTDTGGTPGGTTGGDDPFAKDRDPNVSVENVGKEWVTLGGAATGAGAAAGVVGGYGGGGSYGNYYATNTGNTTGDTSSTTQFAGTTDDEEKKKKAKYIFSSEQAEVENPYEGMEPDSLYGNNVVYDTLEPNSNGNATDTTSMDADGTNLGTILGIGGISAGLGVGGLYMAQAKKDAKKEEEEKKKKEQEEKDAESLGLVGGVMASSFIEDDDDDDKKKKKKQNNRSFFN